MNIKNDKYMLDINDIVVEYDNSINNTKHTVLNHLNLQVKKGEFVCVLGPSGCGKTTLLNSIAGFQPYKGKITVNGKEVEKPGADRAVMFQEYGLFPWFNVEDNVSFGPRMRGVGKKECKEIAKKYLKLVGLEEYAKQYPNHLSGGMKQRVSLARVLANEPSFLLMDEPFAALDEQTRFSLQEELLKIWEQNKITCMFITHSISEAVFLADRVIVLMPNPGRIALDFKINIPRIRDRSDIRLVEYEKAISNVIKGEQLPLKEISC